MPECQKIKRSGLDQYGAERFGRLVFATVTKSVGLKGLNSGMESFLRGAPLRRSYKCCCNLQSVRDTLLFSACTEVQPPFKNLRCPSLFPSLFLYLPSFHFPWGSLPYVSYRVRGPPNGMVHSWVKSRPQPEFFALPAML